MMSFAVILYFAVDGGVEVSDIGVVVVSFIKFDYFLEKDVIVMRPHVAKSAKIRHGVTIVDPSVNMVSVV